MKYFVIPMSIFLIFFNSCKIKTNKFTDKVKHPPTIQPNYDYLPEDTIYTINKKICFSNQNFCLDTNKLIFTEFYSNNEIDLLKPKNIKFIDSFRTINITPIDLSTASDSKIIKQFMTMLRIIDNSLEKVIYTDFTEANYDSLNFFINYFFDWRIKNKVHAVDNIKYIFISNFQKGEVNLEAKLDMNILKMGKINRLRIKYKKLKFEDHVVHQYESLNKYCKNFTFNLKLITYHPEYFNRNDFVPNYFHIRTYKFKDEM